MPSRVARVLAAVVAGGALLAGCSGLQDGRTSAAPGATGAGFPLAITDAAGTEHRFDRKVERVLCYWYGCAEMMADLGLLPVASWKDDALATPMYFRGDYAKVGTFTDIKDPEKLAAFEPDLIVHRTPTSKEDAGLRTAGPLFYMDGAFAKGPEAYFQNLRWLAAMTGRTAEAEQAIRRWDGVLAALKAKLPPGAAATEVALVGGFEKQKYYVWFEGSILCNILRDNGMGRCAQPRPAGAAEESGEVSGEYMLQTDPDWIAYLTYGVPADSHTTRTDPVWKRLSAVRSGQVYDAAGSVYCCSIRQMQYTLEEYAYRVFGPAAGYADPGPVDRYDPDAGGANRR